jgi:threonine/homoserine/homoserine lactone efflux protein
VTQPGRAAMFMVVAWLLAAVVLLAAQGMLLAYLGAAGAATLVWFALRALVRQQRAPSMLDRPPLPERYRVADDLRRPLDVVVAVAEQEAESRP